MANTLGDFVASIPNFDKLSTRAHILFMAYGLRKLGRTDFTPGELKEAFLTVSLPYPKPISTRLSQLTREQKPSIVRTRKSRYSLSLYGAKEVKTYLGEKSQSTDVIQLLGNLVNKIQDKNQQAFLAEAIATLKVGAKRATVVMTWLLALDHLQQYILAKKLSDFNRELAKRKDIKIKAVKTKDDFTEIKEIVQIEVTRAAKIITNDVRKILDEKLGIRNTCAHPSDIQIHELKVVNVIEDLVDNVILKYKQ